MQKISAIANAQPRSRLYQSNQAGAAEPRPQPDDTASRLRSVRLQTLAGGHEEPKLTDTELDMRAAVYPVMLYNFSGGSEELGDLRDAFYLGVGSFVRLTDQWSAFVTVAHILPVQLEPTQRIGIAHIGQGQPYWFDEISRHPKADLAWAPIPLAEVPENMQLLSLLDRRLMLPQGTKVGSYGFPFSDRTKAEQGGTCVTFNPIFYAGYIATAWSQEYLETVGIRHGFLTNYGLSFDCPNGLSGAPLLASFGGPLCISGLIYGNRRLEQTLDEFVEERQDGRGTERFTLTRVAHFGVASGLEELHELAAGYGNV